MKTITLFVALLSCGLLFAQSFTKDEVAQIKPFLAKGAKIKYDEHEGIIWVKSDQVNIVKSGSLESRDITMSIYFGITKRDSNIVILPMRFVNELDINGWIFMEGISILYGTMKEKQEGTRRQFTLGDKDVTRKTLGGSRVYEKSDVAASTEIMEFIRLMVTDPKPIDIRYSGKEEYIQQFYGVFLKVFQKEFEPVLNTYDALSEKFPAK